MKNKPPIISWILLAVTTLIFVYIRLRLVSVPLERDEGEYAYAGQQILHGGVPYRNIYNMKFPGVYYCYALFLGVFGNTITAIRLGAIIINLLTTFFLLKGAEKLKNLTAGIFCAATFIILSAATGFHGLMANTEHFVNLFVAIASYFLFSWINNRKKILLLLTGIMAGFACLMKQHGAYFIAVALLAVLIYTPLKKKNFLKIGQNIFILLAGFTIVMLSLVILVLATGTFNKFVFLTIKYGSSYISYRPFSYGITYFFISFLYDINNEHPLWILILISAIFSYKFLTPRSFTIILIWLIFSIVAVFPGYYFREHYFLLIVPVASVYSGLLFNYILYSKININKYLSQLLTSVLFIIAAAYILIGERSIFFTDTPAVVSYKIYGTQFNEAVTVADSIHNYLPSNRNILVVGSEPEIYFYTKTTAASSYMYVYPMMEHQPWRDTMITEFARQAIHNNPVVIVITGGWSIRDTVCQHKILSPLMNSKPGYTLKGICYQNGAYNEPFLWNGDEWKIPHDSLLWEIYVQKSK